MPPLLVPGLWRKKG